MRATDGAARVAWLDRMWKKVPDAARPYAGCCAIISGERDGGMAGATRLKPTNAADDEIPTRRRALWRVVAVHPALQEASSNSAKVPRRSEGSLRGHRRFLALINPFKARSRADEARFHNREALGRRQRPRSDSMLVTARVADLAPSVARLP